MYVYMYISYSIYTRGEHSCAVGQVPEARPIVSSHAHTIGVVLTKEWRGCKRNVSYGKGDILERIDN
jgi:hypothetical protein